MSHFTCLVILPKGVAPKDEQEANSIIDPLLAPFDENTEVEPYAKPCWCVGSIARRDARNTADAESSRKSFDSLIPYGEIDDRWEEHVAAYMEVGKEAISAHPMKDQPNPECSECKGTGTYQSTYNPKSKWDWYQIGGRWDGTLTEDEQNIFPMTSLKRGWSVYAIVTPDGQWNARGDMIWFGTSANESKDWDAMKCEIASAFPEHYGILVDMHI